MNDELDPEDEALVAAAVERVKRERAKILPTRRGGSIVPDTGYVQTVEGIPVAVVQAWLEQAEIMRNALEKGLRIEGSFTQRDGTVRNEYFIPLNDATRTLMQGRLEGIGVVWHLMSGCDENSDHRLHAAVAKWRERQT